MSKKFNISFKKEKAATGLEAVGFPYPNSLIKLNKEEVGVIMAPNFSSAEPVWKISFYVEDPKHPEHHTTRTLSRKFGSDQEAREWCKERLKKLDEIYTLKPLKDD